MRTGPAAADRVALLFGLATFLFVGALRSFLSAVYYDNLVALELGVSALWSLALLAPLVFLVPALRRARGMFVGAALALALARALLAPTRGTPLHLPLAAVAAASFMLLLGRALPLARAGPRAAAAGVALGWALDVALVWLGDSADPAAGGRGLVLLVPAGLLLAWLALGLARSDVQEMAAAPRHAWLAAVALGAWLFLQNTLAGNPYGAARWNEHAPIATAAASLAGLLVGALVAAQAPRMPRAAWLALHLLALLAIVDHALLHSRVFPVLLLALQATLVLDLALLLPRVTTRTLALTGLVALVLHFVYAFTFLFAFVPLGGLWKGQAPTLYLVAALALALPLARAALDAPPLAPRARRAFASLLVLPLALGAFAAVAPTAAVSEPGEELRVLSFNVHQGFSNAGVVDVDVFLRVLDEADADVVALQEADTPRFTSAHLDVAHYLAERSGYHHVYGQPTSAQAFGGALLTRHPVLEWRAYQLPSTSDDRWYTEARLEVRGKDVWVYAVHFALPHEGRIPQAEALLAQAATRSGPKLLVGDFNSCPSGLCPSYEEGVADDVYAKLAASYQDAWVAAGHARDDPAGYTYDAFEPTERIDYVFVSRDLTVVSAETLRSPAARAASDHLPVLAVLRVG